MSVVSVGMMPVWWSCGIGAIRRGQQLVWLKLHRRVFSSLQPNKSQEGDLARQKGLSAWLVSGWAGATARGAGAAIDAIQVLARERVRAGGRVSDRSESDALQRKCIVDREG